MVCCLERVTCGGAAEAWRNHGREIFLRAFWAIVAGFPAGDVMIKEKKGGLGLRLRSSDARARPRRTGGQERRGGQRAIVHGAHPRAGDDARYIRHRRRYAGPFPLFSTFSFNFSSLPSSHPPSCGKKVRAFTDSPSVSRSTVDP